MSNNVVLNLRKRPVKGIVGIPFTVLQPVIESGDKDRLWNMLKGIAKDSVLHDKQWLEQISNWAPEGGASMKDMAPWLRLRLRVNDLDDNIEGPFTLSKSQSELIWKRLTDANFKLNNLSPQFSEFVMDYCAASRHKFENVTDELDDVLDEGSTTDVSDDPDRK